MSEDARAKASASDIAGQSHTRSISIGAGPLHMSSEQLVDGNAAARDEVGHMSNLATSTSMSLTAVNAQVLDDSGFASYSDLCASRTTKRKRGCALSVDEMLPPPPKKLAGSSLSTAEPASQDGVKSIAEASVGSTSFSPSTIIVDDDDGDNTSITTSDGKVQVSGVPNDNEDDSDGDVQTTSETIAQSAAVDSVAKKDKKPSQTTHHLEWYTRDELYADSTLVNKICSSGMEEFLRWEGVDVDKEFPRKGGKYTNVQGERIGRSTAMKDKVQKVHQAYIDARNAGIRSVPQGWTGKGFEHERPFIPVLAHSLPTAASMSPAPVSADIAAPTDGKKRQGGRKTHDTTPKDEGAEVVSQTRSKLQALRRYAAEQISKAYQKRVQDIADDEDSTSKPTISAEVDRLVFDIVDCHTRFRIVRMRQEHGADTEEDIAGITSEMHKYRAELIPALQNSVNWVKGQDSVLLACQFVLQEFSANG
ncbi:hypothetical protein PMIN04_008337 [Paraphaeosphaeria minitans]